VDRDELLAAGDRNLGAVLRHAAATTPGATIDDDGRLVLVSTLPSWPGPYHNGALRIDRSLPPDEVLARANDFFSGRVNGYTVWIADHADADLEAAAVAKGLASLGDASAPRMAIDHVPAAPPIPEGVTLEEVVDEAGRQAYVDVTAVAYVDAFLPADVVHRQLARVDALHGENVRAVVAKDNGDPVAAALTLASDGIASVQLVGTVPAARGRGLAELCTQWTVAAGFELGAEAVVLEASEMGEPVYRRMGFVELSRYRWCFGAPA
jgi:GNAT superfamily N-acetyltransferase